MKQYLILFAFLVGFAICSFAQNNQPNNKVISNSDKIIVIKQKKEKKARVKHPLSKLLYAEVGLGLDDYNPGRDPNGTMGGNNTFGYMVNVGYQMPIGDSRFYYSFEGGVSSRNLNIDRYSVDNHHFSRSEMDLSSFNIAIAPINIGWRPRITKDVDLDFNIGALLSYDLFGSLKGEMADQYKELKGEELKWKDMICDNHEIAAKASFGVWYANKYYAGLFYRKGIAFKYIDVDFDNRSIKFGVNFRYGF